MLWCLGDRLMDFFAESCERSEPTWHAWVWGGPMFQTMCSPQQPQRQLIRHWPKWTKCCDVVWWFSQNQGSPNPPEFGDSEIRPWFLSLGSSNVSNVVLKDKSMIQLNCNRSFDCIAFRSLDILDPNTAFLRRIVRLQHPCRSHALWYKPGTFSGAVNNGRRSQHQSAEGCVISHKP